MPGRRHIHPGVRRRAPRARAPVRRPVGPTTPPGLPRTPYLYSRAAPADCSRPVGLFLLATDSASWRYPVARGANAPSASRKFDECRRGSKPVEDPQPVGQRNGRAQEPAPPRWRRQLAYRTDTGHSAQVAIMVRGKPERHGRRRIMLAELEPAAPRIPAQYPRDAVEDQLTTGK